MESSEIDQRMDMKFCFKLGKTATETHEMLVRVYGDAAMYRRTVYKWFERFRGGAELTADVQRSGRPPISETDENVSKINEMIRENRTLTIREIFNASNISFGLVQLVLTKNLNMRDEWVRHLFHAFCHKNRNKSACRYRWSCVIVQIQIHFFLQSLITGDESWVYGYDPEKKM
jgi:hypothetical protein